MIFLRTSHSGKDGLDGASYAGPVAFLEGLGHDAEVRDDTGGGALVAGVAMESPGVSVRPAEGDLRVDGGLLLRAEAEEVRHPPEDHLLPDEPIPQATPSQLLPQERLRRCHLELPRHGLAPPEKRLAQHNWLRQGRLCRNAMFVKRSLHIRFVCDG